VATSSADAQAEAAIAARPGTASKPPATAIAGGTAKPAAPTGPGAPDPEATARLRAVIGKLSRHLRPTLAGSQLTPSQISVLFTIVRLGPLGLSEVAEIESLNPTMLSRIAAQLCDAGLIRRNADPNDRRAALVQSTPAGRRMRERIHRERTQALGEHVEHLGPEERAALWSALPVLEELAEQIKGRRA
jgi:DNA-binding MarR family transcriptional regulator